MPALAIALLTEEALSEEDVRRIMSVHAEEDPPYTVVVPADTERNLLADVLDHLSLLEFREALDAVRGEDEDDRTPAEAAVLLDETLSRLRVAGAEASGEVVDGDPVAALMRITGGDGTRWEVVVVTRPHAVEDTFHTDWASQARKRLGLPVLHVYAGSTFLG